MRWLILAAIVLLAACSTNPNTLRYTSSNDPVWQLNPGKWDATPADLTAVAR